MAEWPFEDVKRLIFVGAHPDDLETIAGGTIYRMAQKGVEIIEVLCTDGNAHTIPDQFTRKSLARSEGAEKRTARHNFASCAVFRMTRMAPSLEVRAELAAQYRILSTDYADDVRSKRRRPSGPPRLRARRDRCVNTVEYALLS